MGFPRLAGTTRKIVLTGSVTMDMGRSQRLPRCLVRSITTETGLFPRCRLSRQWCGGFDLVDEGAVGTDNCAYTLLLKPPVPKGAGDCYEYHFPLFICEGDAINAHAFAEVLGFEASGTVSMSPVAEQFLSPPLLRSECV